MIYFLLVCYLFLILIFWNPVENPELKKKVKTWQQFEAEKEKRTDGKRNIFFEKDGKKVKSAWKAGHCFPRTKFKKL